jgi:6,7-dimethyl-8-ribityllumazine synthase
MTSTSNLEQNSANRIAFIQACWHSDIVNQCKHSFLTEIAKRCDHTVDLIEVPGAFEIPLQAKLLAKTGKYAAIVAAGLVTDGGIYRHEFVAQAVITGLMQVQLETEVPVFSVVLTPHNFHESQEHKTFFSEHFVVKGAEAASACCSILERHA